jgi:hypothetical protein
MSGHPHRLPTPRRLLALCFVSCTLVFGATPAAALAGNGNGKKATCDPTVSFCNDGRKNG